VAVGFFFEDDEEEAVAKSKKQKQMSSCTGNRYTLKEGIPVKILQIQRDD
jgi:hypothetical protein